MSLLMNVLETPGSSFYFRPRDYLIAHMANAPLDYSDQPLEWLLILKFGEKKYNSFYESGCGWVEKSCPPRKDGSRNMEYYFDARAWRADMKLSSALERAELDDYFVPRVIALDLIRDKCNLPKADKLRVEKLFDLLWKVTDESQVLIKKWDSYKSKYW